MFITFEGGEGTGKSTQVQRLGERFRAENREAVTTREPGGTPEGEQLRSLLVSGRSRWSAEAEALLNYAQRDVHLTHVIRPNLAENRIVICDRFMDSTRAYQGFAGGCSMEFIDRLEQAIVRDTRPALTLIFDLDPAIGLSRAGARGDDSEDRFERKGLEFHQKLREGFLLIARADPQRCKIIDASKSIDEVATRVWQALNG